MKIRFDHQIQGFGLDEIRVSRSFIVIFRRQFDYYPKSLFQPVVGQSTV
jgi:hypothetical protein